MRRIKLFTIFIFCIFSLTSCGRMVESTESQIIPTEIESYEESTTSLLPATDTHKIATSQSQLSSDTENSEINTNYISTQNENITASSENTNTNLITTSAPNVSEIPVIEYNYEEQNTEEIPTVIENVLTNAVQQTINPTIPSISTQPITNQITLNTQCRAAAFYHLDDRKLIYSDNLNTYTAPASLTKLLTASVAFYYINSDEVFTVGTEQYFVQPYSSLCYISQGNKLKLYDLVTGMLMSSGNDAAYTIAVSTARELNPNVQMTDAQAVEYFCGLMNEFANTLGMKNSHFVNPDGWDDNNQYTTVSDLILLAEYAWSVPEIRDITGTYQKYVEFESGENAFWTNSNCLLNPYSSFYCDNAVGLKTGSTEIAGNCLIALFEKNGNTYISVVVGCDTDYDRYYLTTELFSKCV